MFSSVQSFSQHFIALTERSVLIADECPPLRVRALCRRPCLPGSYMRTVILTSWRYRTRFHCQSCAVHVMFSYVFTQRVLIQSMWWWLVSDNLVFYRFYLLVVLTEIFLYLFDQL